MISAKEKNFWILLTAFALILLAARGLTADRHHRVIKVRKQHRVNQSCNPAPHCSAVVEQPQAVNYLEIRSRIIKEEKRKRKRKRRKRCGSQQSQHHDGLVRVKVLVNEKGRVISFKDIRSQDPHLRHGVEVHIEDLKFFPAYKNQKPYASWTEIYFGQ